MSGNLWERFESIATVEEVEVAKEKSSFTPIEPGTYKATIEELAPSESKDGLPMLKGKFRLESNRILFYNQMLQNLNYPDMTAVNIADAVNFISRLVDTDVKFEGLGKLAELVAEIGSTDTEESVIGTEYNIKVSYGKKDTEMKFPKISVLGVVEEVDVLTDEDIPF
jgi:hypothetical protein